MKTILSTTLILSLLSLAIAAPLTRRIEVLHELAEPVMTVGGQVVAYEDTNGMGTKRDLEEKRGNEDAVMTVNGGIVPYANDGQDMGTRRRRDLVEQKRGNEDAVMTVNGGVVPYSNDGQAMGTKKRGNEDAVMTVNGGVVPYANDGQDMGTK